MFAGRDDALNLDWRWSGRWKQRREADEFDFGSTALRGNLRAQYHLQHIATLSLSCFDCLLELSEHLFPQVEATDASALCTDSALKDSYRCLRGATPPLTLRYAAR